MPRTWTLVSCLFGILMVSAVAQDARRVEPNYKQAERFSPAFINQFVHSTSVSPNWIGETDQFWYRFKDTEGSRYFRVDPESRTKTDLFDHDIVAAKVSEATRKPVESHSLNLGRASIDEKGTVLSFTADRRKFELNLETHELSEVGEAEEESEEDARVRRFRERSGGEFRFTGRTEQSSTNTYRAFSPDHTAYLFVKGHNLYYVEASDETKAEIEKIEARLKAEAEKAKSEGDDEDSKKDESEKEESEEEEGDKDKKDDSTKRDDDEKGDQDDKGEKEKDQDVEDDQEGEGDEREGRRGRRRDPNRETDERRLWANDVDESEAIQLNEDGEEDYAFSSSRGRGRGGQRQNSDDDEEDAEDRKTRPRISWSEDGSTFYVSRSDSRDVAELFLVNSLAEPRPTLEKYKYPMPGEENIRKTELHVFDRESKKLTRIEPVWVDEGYRNIHWGETADHLRFIRQDRLLRNVELTEYNIKSHEFEVLIREGFEAATISTQSVRYIKDDSQMLWWSERSGWGHYYLYDRDGTFKNAVTSGPFRVSRIVAIDEEKGLLYFRANGHPEDTNIYFDHLYRVFLDGTGQLCLDPGDANHRSVLSPSKKFIVDNCSRVDMPPIAMLRDAEGKNIMDLETTDTRRLEELGWQMPERFMVKAADGVTDLYGNMWKPFDFDPNKKYPIIAEVYPGPQTEGVSHTFSAANSRQQLAQIGFVVIQVGHRGGTPGRSKAYHSYGYFNLRDYGLADKKAAIEQLAIRHEYIDIDRVGIYGHSGGGFMTATALLLPPYSKFFKVGVSSAGNHDNNIYNNSWSERYHGLKEVAVKEEEEETEGRRRRGQRGFGEFFGGGRRGGERRGNQGGERGAYQDEEEDGKEDDEKKDDQKKEDEKDEGEKEDTKKKVTFEIDVPTTTELAANLEGKLLLVHGEIDNNVHPAGTMRLVNELIKEKKRFDMLIIPGKRHGFGNYQEYFRHVMWEYFAEHLLDDRRQGADIYEK